MLLPLGSVFAQAVSARPELVAPGIWRLTFGQPEAITPVATRHFPAASAGFARLPAAPECPVTASASLSERGCLIRLPLAADELIYGLGLQLQSFQQRGLKKKLRVNADPAVDTGDSHAPVPFYVTTRGYGVLVDTARYATFYFGNKKPKPATAAATPADDGRNDGWNGVPPYEQKGLGEASEVLVEVPAAGATVYIFAGPSLREAVQRYNLFSGGGAMPPRWGLGFWYRAQTSYGQEDLLNLAAELRARRMPCDVLGLEPHWQSHSYSCSFVWGPRFPQPPQMLAQLKAQHFRVNLWEHAFTHPSAPIYRELLPHAGDHEVWGGLVPDFLQPEARRIFARQHETTHLEAGVAGYKLDECDNSDFTGNWSFPELSRFPSGADGEQMHQLLGLRYQDAILEAFEGRGQRTYGLVRSSGALAAPYPFVLYSDLYHHGQFVHGVAQAGFSGLLWTPEVRDARNPEDLVRRLQAVCLSPLAMINAWYLRHPPWKQMDRDANNAGEFAPGWEAVEAACREVIELRMRFVPYLQAAFARYHEDGIPPCRALVMDFPDDPAVRDISDQFLLGDDLLVAPVVVPEGQRRGRAGEGIPRRRSLYLPAGDWYDFWTGEKLAGGKRITVDVPLARIPLYVRGGAILPLAPPTLHTEDAASFELEARVYGDGHRGGMLCEDGGAGTPILSRHRLEWDAAQQGRVISPSGTKLSYRVKRWSSVP